MEAENTVHEASRAFMKRAGNEIRTVAAENALKAGNAGIHKESKEWSSRDLMRVKERKETRREQNENRKREKRSL